jgi:hypothetical protein
MRRLFNYLVVGCLAGFMLAGCGGGSSSSDTAVVTPPPPPPPPPVTAPACIPGGDPVELTGGVDEADEKTYAVLPVDVRAGTTRVEVGYSWTDRQPLGGTPVTQTVFDLGIYDADGYRSPAGFRGWSGSRQGKIQDDQDPIFIQADSADRGYYPGAVEIGVWYVELGFAAVAPGGADWTVQVRCLNPVVGPAPAADPVNANHVARAEAGWYHGDFHMHGFHSNPNAPDWDDLVQQARDAQLDFLMFTDYVTGRHWNELGAVQRDHPDLVIWPGREIITYFGHANTHGETPGVFEYRHGFEDVNLGDIQRAAKEAGALFQVNHPTTFPGPVFENFCRGCEFTLGGQIDWNLVDTIEVANGPTLVTAADLGLPLPELPVPLQIQNPFLATASLQWNELLQQGYKIAPVSGCDSKGVDAPAERERKGYGCSATAVYANNLSRAALTQAIKAGHLYIRARGVAHSPVLEMTVTTADGQTGMFGDTLTAEQATMTVTVRGGANQLLRVLANDLPLLHIPITSDPFTHTQPIARVPLMESPLGTTWRVETLDAQSLTTIGNPVFLKPAP